MPSARGRLIKRDHANEKKKSLDLRPWVLVSEPPIGSLAVVRRVVQTRPLVAIDQGSSHEAECRQPVMFAKSHADPIQFPGIVNL